MCLPGPGLLICPISGFVILKFYEHCRLEDDRGPGIDTIYYYHGPVAKKKSRQVMKQYRLTGNFLFLLLLVVLTLPFVTAWS